jgi:hypothetical protein
VLNEFIFCNHISELEMIGDKVVVICFSILTLLLLKRPRKTTKASVRIAGYLDVLKLGIFNT